MSHASNPRFGTKLEGDELRREWDRVRRSRVVQKANKSLADAVPIDPSTGMPFPAARIWARPNAALTETDSTDIVRAVPGSYGGEGAEIVVEVSDENGVKARRVYWQGVSPTLHFLGDYSGVSVTTETVRNENATIHLLWLRNVPGHGEPPPLQAKAWVNSSGAASSESFVPEGAYRVTSDTQVDITWYRYDQAGGAKSSRLDTVPAGGSADVWGGSFITSGDCTLYFDLRPL